MATVVRMPSVMANATEAAIQTWLVTEGATVDVGTPLAEIETEKAVVDYAAEESGTVGRLLADTGVNVEVGTPIAVILAAGEGMDAIAAALEAAGLPTGGEPAPAESVDSVEARAEDEEPEPEAPLPVSAASAPAEAAPAASPSAPAPANGAARPDGGRRFASPIVRRLARERGIALEHVAGSGPDGRIVRRDLDALPAETASQQTPAQQTRSGAPAAPMPAETPAAGYTDEPLTGMRRAIARRLTESKTTVPHFYMSADVRVEKLLALRTELNASAPRRISVNDLVIKAVAGALVDVPAANAVWNGDSVRRFHGVDLAVAVAVDDGLLTPVLRGVQDLPLLQVSERMADLAARAKAGRLRQDELEGGAFSISNLGMYDVDAFTAILNPPQAGILAVAAAKQRPVVQDGRLEVGTVMTVTLSADHRVIDGAVAAQWLSAFVARVQAPLRLLL